MKSEHTPIPIAIVGLGFGTLIVRALQHPELRKLFRVAALCDLDPKKTAELSREIGAQTMTLEQILADEGLPVIGLFTGPANRAELIRRAIHAGKHVMTTKPFERDSRVAQEVLEEAMRLRKIVHLNAPAPLLPPDLAQIRRWQHQYNLGRPISAQASAWARYREKADGGWYDDPTLCPAAPIFRLGIYLINDVIEFFGELAELHVMTSRIFTGRPTPDNAQLNLKFQDGGMVNIQASFCVGDGDPYRNSLTLNFENGTVYRNGGPEGRAGAECTLSLVIPEENGCQIVETVKLDDRSGDYQWNNFHRAISTGELPPRDYSTKVAAGLRVIEAMYESERKGASIKLRD